MDDMALVAPPEPKTCLRASVPACLRASVPDAPAESSPPLFDKISLQFNAIDIILGYRHA
jgi:hypothetical protein